MNGKRLIPILILFILIFIRIGTVFAQAPNIFYSSSQNYTVNTAITPLAPTNTGGKVIPGLNGPVITFAGNPNPGVNDGQGTAATFNGPTAVAADAVGNLYVADAFNNLIRKIDVYGQVVTLAGSGTMGSADGVGNQATFNHPMGIAVDISGNIFVGDTYNNLIRKITPSGSVTTVAGSGQPGSTDGVGNSASFSSPAGLTIDGAGNLYVADQSNNLIRKVSPVGAVTTFAGTGVYDSTDGSTINATFQAPTDITMDANGNFYVVDDGNLLIRKITPGGVVSAIAGASTNGVNNGQGPNGHFNFPAGIVSDASGNLYVTDYSNNEIRKIDPNGNVTTFAGSIAAGSQNGSLLTATFNQPTSIEIDKNGNIFIADRANNEIREMMITGYTIDKQLPPGLAFDTNTGIISGTPTASSPATDYTVTAYNTSGSSSTIVNIAVNASTAPALSPPKISYQTPQAYAVNTAITPLAPKNTGGAVPQNAYGQVSTFAGDGATRLRDGQGTSASFFSPEGVVTDKSGNMFVADGNNFAIRKITPQGVVNTIQLTGLGNKAFFPFDITVDGNGNLYVADPINNIIWKILPTGAISVLAGGTQGATNGLGTLASFNDPLGVVVDNSGIVYVADSGNGLIRKVDPNGLVSTFASGFQSPGGLAIDSKGFLYVTNSNGVSIEKISPGGVVSFLAGGSVSATDGTGAAAGFNSPHGLVVDNLGNVYVADTYNNLVRKITPSGVVTTLAGNNAIGFTNGIGAAASFYFPEEITIDAAGNLYVSDMNNNVIRKISATGYTINNLLPSGLNFDPATGIISGTPTAASPATDYTVTAYNTSGSSSTIVNIAVNANAAPVALLPPNISYQTPQTYITNTAITPLVPTNTGGAVPATIYGQVSTFAGNTTLGSANGQGASASFFAPVGIAADAAGNIYVGDEKNSLIRKITPGGLVTTLAGTGTVGNANGNGTAASFDHPQGLAIDASGKIYVADQGNSLIREIDAAGNVTNFAGTGAIGSNNGTASTATFNYPYSVAVDGTGVVYVGEGANNLIRKIDPGNYIVTTFAGSGKAGSANGNSTAASFKNPEGIAVDATGNLYVADTQNNQIRKITPSGNVTAYAGSGFIGSADGKSNVATFNYPDGVAVDAAGNVYVADQLNNLIRKIDRTGLVTTLAGNGTVGSTDGIGTLATFDQPSYMTVDAAGNLYVADSFNNEIREIVTTGYTIDKPLPAGLSFDPKTGIINGTPTIASPAVVYTITAYNTAGSNPTPLSITIIDEQTVAFGPLPPKTVCDADFDAGALGSGPITYTSSNPAVATIVAGKIHITGGGTTIITASDSDSQLTQTLTVDAALIPTITISPDAADNCQGMPVTYTATVTNGGTSPVYQWQVNGQNSGTNSPSFTSSSLNDNDKITCILTNNVACATTLTTTSNTAVFTIDHPMLTAVNITLSTTGPICQGAPVTFIATVNTSDANPTYHWLINGKNAGNNSPIFTSSNLGNGDMVTCNLNSAGKCLINPIVSSNAITINFSPASTCLIIIPNTFTPNGDGINDLWNITALVNYPYSTIRIFNRYGTLVYNSIGYPKPWDGTYNGKPLPVGTYYYIVDPKNGQKTFTGSVMIVR